VTEKIRIDQLLVERGLVESRNEAQRIIMAGEVRVGGQLVFKPAHKVARGEEIHLEQKPRFVSQGGDKLDHALHTFEIQIEGAICADVGASTGGFTDCLLQNGAARVYAVDVGKGQLHWKLRNDPRIVIMEGINARYLSSLPEMVGIITIDVSFISLRLIFPAVLKWMDRAGSIIALVKPQFEAGRELVGRGGIVRDPNIHRQVLLKVMTEAKKLGLHPKGLIGAPVVSPRKNVEYLLWLSLEDGERDLDQIVNHALSSAGPKLSSSD
jgi:23S rRNA (cytidine1920-2'-O)/16S rRNA (cytidine1409-2'-O)-methyltransferase